MTEKTRASRAIRISERGVYRDDFAPAGWAEFIIVDSRGTLRRRIGMPVEDVDEDTVPEMDARLNAIDPLLRVMT